MNRVAKLCKIIGLTAFAVLLVGPNAALAHGEKSQQAHLRMRTVHWWDFDVGPTKVSVNDELTMSGKFRPSQYWPTNIAPPGISFLQLGVPGPSFLRLETRINGKPQPQSMIIEKGGDYSFEVSMRARLPGDWHIHPILHVDDAGPLLGPGFWVNVGGERKDFVNRITTLTGEDIDLETYGKARVFTWHIIWTVFALVWLLYWVIIKGPMLMPRYRRTADLGDNADLMITRNDKILGGAVYVGSLALILGGYLWAQKANPVTIPLQTGNIPITPLEPEPSDIDWEVHDARYAIPGRSFRLEMTFTNNNDVPVRIGEFMTGHVRFLNPDVLTETVRDSHHTLAPTGLSVDGGDLIGAGETRRVVIRAEDAMWETMGLYKLIENPDSHFSGLLFFFDEEGTRYMVEPFGSFIPTFEMD